MMATLDTVEQAAFPFHEESDIDELDVIGASGSTRSTTVVGDVTPRDHHVSRKLTLDTIIIPARKDKRSRTPSLSEKDDPHAGIQKKQKIEGKKAVGAFLPIIHVCTPATDMSPSLCLARIASLRL